MPTENEFRYVLHGDVVALIERLTAMPNTSVEIISQGDLSTGVRLRRTVAGSVETRTLAYKRDVNGDKIEIETEVSLADFTRLWPSCEQVHAKTRYKFADGELHWDVDIYGDLTKPYFMRAECEAPCYVSLPPAPHPALEDFILHVAGKAKGFSSRRVADPKYARKLMKALLSMSETAKDAEESPAIKAA